MFGTMDPFQKYMAKTPSSVDSRGKAVDQLVASLESGHAKQSTKIKKLEKLADKHDTEQLCVVFNISLSAPGALGHSLQRRTACNTSPPTISKMGIGQTLLLYYWTLQSTFVK